MKYSVQGSVVLVEGPKGKWSSRFPPESSWRPKTGTCIAVRESDSQAAIHGLTRALISNAVEGVTKGWSKDLDIVGIGYRAELKGKNTVVFTLGYSHPIEFPLPTGDYRDDRPQADPSDDQRHRPAEGWAGGGGYAVAAQTRSL